MPHEPHGAAPEVDQGLEGRVGGRRSRLLMRRFQRLIDEPQRVGLRAAERHLDPLRCQLPQVLPQAPGAREVQRNQRIGRNEDAAYSGKIDIRQRRVDLRQLQRAPLARQLKLQAILGAPYVEESAQADTTPVRAEVARGQCA